MCHILLLLLLLLLMLLLLLQLLVRTWRGVGIMYVKTVMIQARMVVWVWWWWLVVGMMRLVMGGQVHRDHLSQIASLRTPAPLMITTNTLLSRRDRSRGRHEVVRWGGHVLVGGVVGGDGGWGRMQITPTRHTAMLHTITVTGGLWRCG